MVLSVPESNTLHESNTNSNPRAITANQLLLRSLLSHLPHSATLSFLASTAFLHSLDVFLSRHYLARLTCTTIQIVIHRIRKRSLSTSRGTRCPSSLRALFVNARFTSVCLSEPCPNHTLASDLSHDRSVFITVRYSTVGLFQHRSQQ